MLSKIWTRRSLTSLFLLVAVSVIGMPQQFALGQVDEQEPAPPAEEQVEATEKPFSFGISYSLLSDYIFRAVNFSEYSGEGREKLNHQVSTSLDVPLGPGGQYGTLGFDTFFEWYADQEKISGDDANIQEIDYTIRWSYDLEQIATTATLGWTAFVFPNVSGVGDNDRTHEWFLNLEHNDAWAWRWAGYQGDEGVLNPSFLLAHDLHISGGVWMELGLSHPFELVENLTATPGVVFAIDGGYLGPLLGTDDHDFRYASTILSLDLTYDLTELLQLPEWAGSVSLGGQLYYSCPTESVRHTGAHDEFWGGMTVAWNW